MGEKNFQDHLFIWQIYASSKITVTFKPTLNFDILYNLRFPKPVQESLFYDWQRRKHRGGRGLITHLTTTVFVEQPLALPGSANNILNS